MNLPNDIIERIKIDFPDGEEQELVQTILSSIQINEKFRVIRCMLFSANGNINKLDKLESLAKVDYRDVIMAGEYEYPSNKRLRDFNEPFNLNS